MSTNQSKPSPEVTCSGCSLQFPSKNQLFRHLADSTKTCLSPEEYKTYLTQVNTAKKFWEKIGVLYGYLPGTDYRFGCTGSPCGIEGGQHAAWLVTQAIEKVTHGERYQERSDWSARCADPKINRSYGSTSRGTMAAEQDHNTGAVTEVLCMIAVPLLRQQNKDWVEMVNAELRCIFDKMRSSRTNVQGENETNKWSAGSIQVFGRVHIPNKRFNAEADVVQRRADYCFPADLLLPDGDEVSPTALAPNKSFTVQEHLDTLQSFPPGNKSYRVIDISKNAEPSEDADNEPTFFFKNDAMPAFTRPNENTLRYLSRLKKLMQYSFQTQVEELNSEDKGAVLEKELNDNKRKNQKAPQKKRIRVECKDNGKSCNNTAEEDDKAANDDIGENDDEMAGESTSEATKVKRLLRRKRYHNFSPNVLAHDYLAYRRVDRFYHRGTIRPEMDKDTVSVTTINNRPFFVFSLTGDILLHQQVVRVVGLLIAICRGVIDEDIVDCIFDEEFTHLVPAPPAPSLGLLAGECSYITWEGRIKTILSARPSNRFYKGWNDEEIIENVKVWEQSMLNEVAKGWYWNGLSDDGKLKSETDWVANVLKPWADQTKPLLEEYRRWKSSSTNLPTAPIDTNIPILYEKVLHHLRLADSSGEWPSTSAKRQLVMLSTSKDGSQITPLSVAHSIALSNPNSGQSPYSFAEGEGGASGSFSVGIMPDGGCNQPKGNLLFPELVKAAFELEIALKPDRPPSSTIAINRNAQFRPHTDNGAGAGQSTSLIVGLGNYSGGELMVEGVKKDIRYQPIEFDGWKERHWTLPFNGERFSLVWFTPKGCEGKRGIDLYPRAM
ncbi:hypothetical protein ACHAXN_006317 [Cyclotella atomus]